MAYSPVLRKEVVDAPPLGEVVVRMIKLSERIALRDAKVIAENTFVPRLLALAVSGKDGEPIFDIEGWDIFAVDHQDSANRIFDVAVRLSGMDGEAAKNG